jgi:putative ABC transport system permease protein
MIRSFMHAYRANLGFNTADVLSMEVDLPPAKYKTDEQQRAFFDRVTASLDATPGVAISAVTTSLPLGGWWTFSYEIEGQPQPDARLRPSIDAVISSPDYFSVIGLPMVAGRGFTAADGTPSSSVAIVNRQFADQFLHGENPIGKRLRVYEKDVAQPWLTIVGVLPNLSQRNEERSTPRPTLYLPFRQKTNSSMTIAARTNVPPASLKETFRRKVQAIDDTLPVRNLRTMDEQLERQNWPYRVFGILFSIFAAIALGLASVGLYAVIAHSVSQRTQEIGVRIALGARDWNILRLVFSQGMTQLAIGLVIGLAAARAVTSVLQTLLIDVSPSDPATFVSVSLVLAAAAIFGCLIPARRAMRVDPIEALRHE